MPERYIKEPNGFQKKLSFKDKNIAAFTIWEALVAMIITSIIVTLSYKVYLIATNSLHVDFKNQESLQEIVILEKDLFRQIELSDSMTVFDNTISIDSENPWFLEFGDSTLIITKWNENESQEYKVKGYHFYFINNNSDILIGLEIEIFYNNLLYRLLYEKKYSNAFLLKQNH